jgi:hypothetical protein
MTTMTFTTTTNDLYGSTGGMFPAHQYLQFGTDQLSTPRTRVWIPFNVTLPKNLNITSATLKIWSAFSTGAVGQHIGCEAADNPSTPATWADLGARTQTTAKLTITSMPSYTQNTEITFDVTTAVQEVLNRAGWVNNNTMAILSVDDGNTNNFATRRFYSFDDVNFLPPILDIVFDQFIPRGGAM